MIREKVIRDRHRFRSATVPVLVVVGLKGSQDRHGEGGGEVPVLDEGENKGGELAGRIGEAGVFPVKRKICEVRPVGAGAMIGFFLDKRNLKS